MSLDPDQLAKLQSLVSERPSRWRENARYRTENKDWLKKSQSTAIIILGALSNQKITQKDLAERLGVSPQQVSKWVKGKENFTLETISKLEKALNIKILTIGEPKVKEEEVTLVTVTHYQHQSEYPDNSELTDGIELSGNVRPLYTSRTVNNYKGL